MAESFLEIRFDPETARALQNPEFRRRQANHREYVTQAVLLFFGKRAQVIAGDIIQNSLSGQRLKRRTGSLARSIVGVSGLFRGRAGLAPALRVGIFRGPALQYAGVQEYGTQGKNPASPYPTIRPKKGRALAIPLGSALTPAGVARYESPRQYPGELRLVPFRRGISQGGFSKSSDNTAIGGLYEARSLRQDDEGRYDLDSAKLAYLLVRQVDIAPKWYLRDAFDAALPQLAEDLSRYLAELLTLGNRPTVEIRRGA